MIQAIDVKNKIVEILEDVTIVYNNGEKEFYNAINITNSWVFTGHFRNNKEFIEGGGIPKDNIKDIICNMKRRVYKEDF